MTTDLKKLKGLLRNEFIIGAGTAAYQVEGAAREDGRTDSVWDVFCRQPGNVIAGDSGDIACDHYHRWQEDIQWLVKLGLDVYRFSISWSRIIPHRTSKPNQKGIDFYIKLIDGLLAEGIRPMVTLYHWDLPQYLQDEGGWQSRQTAEDFAEFVAVVVSAFGQKVNFYTTINEPWCVAFLGHKLGIHAPGIKDKTAPFCAAHHLLLAHGLGVQKIRQHAPHAQVGIVLNGGICHPESDSLQDAEAAQLAEHEQIYVFSDPLFKKEYPKLLQKQVAQSVHPGDLDIIAERCDYVGWNYYTRNVIRADAETDFECVTTGEYELTDMGWEVYPQGLVEVISMLKQRYDLPPVYITENGAAFKDNVNDEQIADQLRVDYFLQHWAIVNQLIDEGYDIRGYVCWSLLDNFEWAEGYAKRFGLIRVDYETQKRTLKDSGKLIAELMRLKRN